MAVVLFVLSVLAFIVAVGAGREGNRTEALAAYLASTIPVLGCGYRGCNRWVGEGLAKRFPRTGREHMMADYWRHEEDEEGGSGKKK